jgi:fatty acid synthase subunit alpha
VANGWCEHRHQFCSPVQWYATNSTKVLAENVLILIHRIDTQDCLFDGEDAIERLIEIGPANTLVNMAQKTLAASFKTQDSARGRRRELLGYHKHADTIYYRSQENEEPTAPVASSPVTPAAAPVVPAVEATPVAAPPVSQTSSAAIPDAPLKSLDMFLTIVALGLKKTYEQISIREPLKQLCNGKIPFYNWYMCCTCIFLASNTFRPINIAK